MSAQFQILFNKTIVNWNVDLKKYVLETLKIFCTLFLIIFLFGCAGTAKKKYTIDESGNVSLNFNIKNEGDFKFRDDDKVSIVIGYQGNSAGKTLIHLEMHNRSNNPIIRTTSLDNTQEVSGEYTSKNVLVDIIAGLFVKITIFPGGKIAAIFDKDQEKHTFFPFADGSHDVIVSIIGNYTDANGKTYGRGLYGFEYGNLIQIQTTPNYNLEARYNSYQDVINGTKDLVVPGF